MDNAKIADALAKLAKREPNDAVWAGPAYHDTGLTVGELRKALEALRWIEASTLPPHSRPVQVETGEGRGIGRYCGDGTWDGIDAPLHDVLRWRELPR